MSLSIQPELGANALPEAAEHSPSRALVVRSDFDTFYGAYARRSEFKARLVRENPAIVDMLVGDAAWIMEYCRIEQIPPELVRLRSSMTPEGVMVMQLSRKDQEEE